MDQVADASRLEALLGVQRDLIYHQGQLSSNGTFRILHARWCVDLRPDLRVCEYSQAYDRWGVLNREWPRDFTVKLDLAEVDLRFGDQSGPGGLFALVPLVM